jgi:hypothetical protein
VQAIPFRERQLRIEQRHPRVWLSYAYDLRAAGRLSEARAAFEKMKEFQVFLTQDIRDQIPQIEKDFDSSLLRSTMAVRENPGCSFRKGAWKTLPLIPKAQSPVFIVCISFF